MEISNMYIVYKTTNLVNQKIYIGVHKLKENEDTYLGSGLHLNRAIKKYGRKKFKRETLFKYDNNDNAYQKEKELVNEEFIKRTDTYNLKIGGRGSELNGKRGTKNTVNVKDLNGNTFKVSVSDPRYLSGELISLVTGSGNPMYGKKQSKESNEKNRQSHLGKITSDETKEKLRIALSGTNAPLFIGWYITPDNVKHVSLGAGQTHTRIPARTFSRYCIEYSNRKISNHSYTSNEYLHTLGERCEVVGKTFSEIGFGFEPKS